MPRAQQDQLTDAERAALAAAVDRIERAAVITAIGRRLGTLPPDLAYQRGADLSAEAAEGRKIAWMAAKIRRSPSIVSRLIIRHWARTAATA